MVLAKLAERLLGVASTLILARLLLPEDFGLVAVATAIVAILELLTGFGFDLALIRDRDANRDHYDTAWSLNVAIGVGIAALMLLLAVPAGDFFRDGRVTVILVVLSMSPILAGMENIGVVAFRKELRFRREFVFLTGKKVAMFATAVPLAAIIGNYWALVSGIVAGRLAGTLLSYWMHPYRPRWSLKRCADLLGFSKWMFVVNIVNFIKLRFADFAIGRLEGPGALGIYNVGSEIASMPTSELVAPINRAVFPGYSLMEGDKEALRRAYLSVTGVVALLALPAGAGIAAFAPVLVPLALGPRWLDAIPVMQILAFFGLVTALQSNSFSIFLAIGKPRIPAILGGGHALLLMGGLIAVVPSHGILGAAWVTLVTGLVLMPVNFLLLMRNLDCRIGEILAVLWRPLIATAVMYWLVAQYVSQAPAATLGELAMANAAAVGLGTAVYAAAALMLWALARRPNGAETAVLERVPVLASLTRAGGR